MDFETVFSWVIGLSLYGALWLWMKRWEQRAAAKDHTAAASRDAVIPECCVGCRSPHATHPLTVGTFFVGISPMAQLLDNRFKRSFTFRCCLRCVRPIHRRRRIGIVLTAIGAVIVLACFTFIVLLELSPAFVELARTYLRPTSGVRLLPLYVLILLFIVGFLSAFLGLWMRAYSPFVRIMDGGGEQIYFHFRSQLYRTQFAQLNGEA